MSGSTPTKRLVPVDLLFSSDDLVPSVAPNAVRFQHLALAPTVNIAPYMGAFKEIQVGTMLLDDYHKFEKSRVAPNSYDEISGERRIRQAVNKFRRFLSAKRPLIDSISNDRLIVRDGLLEACLAKFQGREWVSVNMSPEVASAWDARSTTELDELCHQQGRNQIYTPIMHPAYRKYNYSRRGSKRLDMIRRHLGPDVNGMTLLDIGCNSGYYVFHFLRQGMDVTGIDMDKEHLDVARAQQSIYGMNAKLLNIPLQDFEMSNSYDVVLAMSVFWHLLGWGKIPTAMLEQELCAKIESLVGRYLFWESGPDPDREMKLITENTGLKFFTKLGTTSATGINDRVFGVFTRNAHAKASEYSGSDS